MTIITTLDKGTVRKLHVEMRESMRVLAQKYGLTIREAGGSFQPLQATLKFQVSINDVDAVETQQKAAFELHCSSYNVRPEHYRKEIVLKGSMWRLIGFELSRPKYCVRMQNVETGNVSLWSDAVLAKVRAR